MQPDAVMVRGEIRCKEENKCRQRRESRSRRCCERNSNNERKRRRTGKRVSGMMSSHRRGSEHATR